MQKFNTFWLIRSDIIYIYIFKLIIILLPINLMPHINDLNYLRHLIIIKPYHKSMLYPFKYKIKIKKN